MNNVCVLSLTSSCFGIIGHSIIIVSEILKAILKSNWILPTLFTAVFGVH